MVGMPMSQVENSPQAVWDALQAGNERFVMHQEERPHQDSTRRIALRAGQSPRAVVLSCSDSRVPVEFIFDVGLGDLFVIRTAGQIIDQAVLGSLEFAIEALEVNLVVVMGHESCGAVKATASALEGGGVPQGFQRVLVEKVAPSILEARAAGCNDIVDFERQNVTATVNQLLTRVPQLRERLDDGRVGVVGLRYRLSDGGTDTVVTRGVE